jgi:acyl carrier protein
MDTRSILDELRIMLVERLKFDPGRAAGVALATVLPKGIEGSLGLDSLDFIELSMAIEERFGIAMDEREELEPHFQSFDTLTRYISTRMVER